MLLNPVSRMTIKLLLLLALCLGEVHGCRYFKNPGLLLSRTKNAGTNILVSTNRFQNTDNAYNALNPVPEVTFLPSNPIYIFRNDRPNFVVRICESGYLEFAPTSVQLQTCKSNAEITGIDHTLPEAVVIADYNRRGAANTNFLVESYQIRLSEQLDATNNVTGPSYCDLQIIAGIIADCQEEDRFNITVQEALVVTWKITNNTSSRSTHFQAFVAVANNNRTFVAFLYEDYTLFPGVNGQVKGRIHAANAGLAGTNRRYSEICGGIVITDIEKRSNCRCAQPGHYVFETTESTTSPHGFCGTETGKSNCTASSTAFITGKADSMTINRNCRYPRLPRDSCDDTYHCMFTSSYRLVVKFKNYAGMDRAVFLNSTIFYLNDGLTGFQAPYGNNIVPLTLACYETIVISSNDTYTTVERSTAAPCFSYDSTNNAYTFVLMLYNNADGANITTDGSRIIVGTCDLDDLSRNISTFINVSDIAQTSVAPRTGQQLTLRFWDSRNETIKQILTTTDIVQRGRYIYPAICFTPATNAINNIDPYAAYPTGCEFANNPMFVNDSSTGNASMTVVMDNGCLSAIPAEGKAGRLLENFKVYPDSKTTITNPICITTRFAAFSCLSAIPAVGKAGRLLEPFKVYPDSKTTITNPICMTTRFAAFNWNNLIPASKLYMRCTCKLCVNRQLFTKSKCFDSCANTLVNANVTDADDAGRRRREVEDEYDLVTSINIVDVITPPVEPRAVKECVDDVMAKGVIGALVALLVLATIMTIILYCVFQKQKQC